MNASQPDDDRNPSLAASSSQVPAGDGADTPSAVGESTFVVSQPGKFSDPDATDAYAASSATLPAHDAPRLGEFDLLHEIGRGGMGVVWRARDRKLDREVAVKLLLDRFAPDTSAASRFLEEARITGQLQHPGIPAVYQISALADGRPFLAMKLIKGRTLSELIKAGAAVDTLSIFAAISQAVGYAHSRGVIHRDLKPQNIMVGAFGEVQVMDWGLAKVLDDSARERSSSDPEATVGTVVRTDRDAETPYTQYGSMVGTPAYMAPEQAVGELDKVGPRADVFGLGAILCTLLTGKPPCDGQTAESVRVAALRGQTAEAFARLDRCAADPEVIALCKRCLAFDPAARPATGEAVAAEVAALRQAADERVRQAERDKLGAEVRAAEQIKRRQALQWSAVAVAAVLLLGITGTTIGMFQAKTAWKAEQLRADSEAKAKTEAEIQTAAAEKAAIAEKAAKEKAEARLAQIEKGVELFAGLLKGLNPRSEEQGGPPLYEQLRERASKAADELVGESVADEEAVARLQMMLGHTLIELGDYDKAVEILERARATREAKLGAEHHDTFDTIIHLALAYGNAGKLPEAIALLEQARPAYVKNLGAEHTETLTVLNNLANLYRVSGRLAEVVALLEQVRDASIKTRGADDADTLQVLNNLAVAYGDAGRASDAIDIFTQIKDALKRTLGADHIDTLTTLNNLAVAYQAAGKLPEAIELLEHIKVIQIRKLGDDHPNTLRTLNNLAVAYGDADRLSEAITVNEQVRDIVLKKLGTDHPNTLTTLSNLAAKYHKAGKLPEAITIFEEVMDAQVKKLGSEHPNTLITLSNLAFCYKGAGKLPKAIALMEEVRDSRLKTLGADHPDTLTTLNSLAKAYQDDGRLLESIAMFEEAMTQIEKSQFQFAGDGAVIYNTIAAYEQAQQFDKAEVWRRKWLAQVKEKSGAESPIYTGELAALALNLITQEKWTDAEVILKECLAIREKIEPDDWRTFNTKAMLGAALLGQKNYADAEPLLLAGYEGMREREDKIPAAGKARLIEALQRLVQLYTALEKPDDAAKWQKELDARKEPEK